MNHYTHPYLSKLSDSALIRLAQSVDSNANNACEYLLERYDNLIQSIIYPYKYGLMNVDDLIQEARIGFMKAVRSFDPLKGTSLGEYARPFIRGSVYTFYKVSKKHLERIVAYGDGKKSKDGEDVQIEDYADPESLLPFELMDFLSEIQAVRDFVTRLTPRQQELVNIVFGQEMKLSDAARQMGLSRARTTQLMNEIRKKGNNFLFQQAN